MPAWLRKGVLLAGLLLLIAYAASPLLPGGFVGEDFPILAAAGGSSVEAGDLPGLHRLSLQELHGVDGSLLSGASTGLSRRIFGLGLDSPGGSGPATPYRLEHLGLLLLGALGLARYARRLLLPWIGSEQARASAYAAAVVLCVHPLSISAVSSLAARGTLLAVALSTWAAFFFVRGRQDRKFSCTCIAAVLCLLAGAASERGLLLPAVLAATELLSSRRYRSLRERLRTATTTLLVFGACALLIPLLYAWHSGEPPLPTLTAGLAELGTRGGAAAAAGRVIEKLGVLILPAGAQSTGILGTALAGLLFLLAMQPALQAARSAPRLWGWLLFGWVFFTVLAELFDLGSRVHPGDLTRAHGMLPAIVVMCVGIGVAATALSGISRLATPLVLAVGYAILAHGNALPWGESAREVGELRTELARARELHGREARLLVIDPPREVGGIEALGSGGRALTWLLHPDFTGESGPREPGAATGLGSRAFLALVREREFDELRVGPVVVMVPERLLDPAQESRQGRVPVRLGEATAPVGPRSWRGESRSPDLDLDPLRFAALRIEAPEGWGGSAVGSRALGGWREGRTVSWRAREPAAADGSERGAWIGSEDAPRAIFDLGGSIPWNLGGRIRRVWFEGGMPRVKVAEVLGELPSLGANLVPVAEGDDWYFDLSQAGEPPQGERAVTYRVGLLDLALLEYVELHGETVAAGRLLVRGAAGHVSRAVRETGGPVAWHLDRLVDDVTVGRARGRRVGRQGAREEPASGDGGADG